MGRRKADTPPKGANGSAAALGFEAKLWLAADKLRNNMNAAEYKHVVLGLIFLKYISDNLEEHRAKLLAGKGEYKGPFKGSNPEDADSFRRDPHPELRTEYVLATPPFNDSDCLRKDDDVHRKYGVPPKGNINFAWGQLFIHHLVPQLEPLKLC